MNITCKKIILCLTVLAVTGLLALYAARAAVIHTAQNKARDIIETAYRQHNPQTGPEKITALTRYVFGHFDNTDPSSHMVLKLRPYLTSRYLPTPLRLPAGVLETHLQKGLCDNAARMLAFLLAQERFDSKQWNMVTDSAGHTALLVFLPGDRYMMADPFYGFVAANTGHPDKLQTQIRNGKRFDELFLRLGADSKEAFYRNFARTRMAAEGDDLLIAATLPLLQNQEELSLGTLDGQPEDVKHAAMKHSMSPYWQYAGHRYNREWVRVLKAQEPIILTFTLTQPAEDGVITATPEPAVNGKDLVWQLDKGEKIIFRDGDARISLKRLNSYIDIDRITIRPATTKTPDS